SQSLDRIREGYRSELRRALRAAARQGVAVEAGAPMETLRLLYPLYRERMQEIGATVKPWRFIEGIVAEGIGTPFVAHLAGRPELRPVGSLPDLAPGTAKARFVTEPALGLPSVGTAHLAGQRVLVTGATGFVGQHVVRALAAGPGGAIRILARSHDRAREVF